MMQGVCSTKEPFDGSKLLYCDDKFLRWIENGSADPEDPDLKIEEKSKSRSSTGASNCSNTPFKTRLVGILEGYGTATNFRKGCATDS